MGMCDPWHESLPANRCWRGVAGLGALGQSLPSLFVSLVFDAVPCCAALLASALALPPRRLRIEIEIETDPTCSLSSTIFSLCGCLPFAPGIRTASKAPSAATAVSRTGTQLR